MTAQEEKPGWLGEEPVSAIHIAVYKGKQAGRGIHVTVEGETLTAAESAEYLKMVLRLTETGNWPPPTEKWVGR